MYDTLTYRLFEQGQNPQQIHIENIKPTGVNEVAAPKNGRGRPKTGTKIDNRMFKDTEKLTIFAPCVQHGMPDDHIPDDIVWSNDECCIILHEDQPSKIIHMVCNTPASRLTTFNFEAPIFPVVLLHPYRHQNIPVECNVLLGQSFCTQLTYPKTPKTVKVLARSNPIEKLQYLIHEEYQEFLWNDPENEESEISDNEIISNTAKLSIRECLEYEARQKNLLTTSSTIKSESTTTSTITTTTTASINSTTSQLQESGSIVNDHFTAENNNTGTPIRDRHPSPNVLTNQNHNIQTQLTPISTPSLEKYQDSASLPTIVKRLESFVSSVPSLSEIPKQIEFKITASIIDSLDENMGHDIPQIECSIPNTLISLDYGIPSRIDSISSMGIEYEPDFAHYYPEENN